MVVLITWLGPMLWYRSKAPESASWNTFGTTATAASASTAKARNVASAWRVTTASAKYANSATMLPMTATRACEVMMAVTTPAARTMAATRDQRLRDEPMIASAAGTARMA